MLCILQQDQGSQVAPGYKISPHNLKVSIEQNSASCDNVAVVENLKS